MRVRVRKGGRSKALDGAMRAIKAVASGAVLSDVAHDAAPAIEKAAKASLRPHRRTGDAEDRAVARATGNSITLENAGYAKFIKGYAFGRRFPKDWVIRLKKRCRAAVRAEMRRVS